MTVRAVRTPIERERPERRLSADAPFTCRVTHSWLRSTGANSGHRGGSRRQHHVGPVPSGLAFRGGRAARLPCAARPRASPRRATPRSRRPPRTSSPSSTTTSPSSRGGSAALQRAWASAPDDCGFIGGPIGVRFTGRGRRWLTDGLLGVLGVADGGRSFHGGNVSFRTEALRGIQGFWPARGRPELHDWFSEEHYAQHELTAAGWSHARAPGAAAVRIVDPARLRRRDVLKCRARYGARSALIGERRPRATAARIAASSAAGAAVAALRGDGVRATERVARAAENAAALVAPLIAHRELQPNATHTPFRHSVPEPQPLHAQQAAAPLARRGRWSCSTTASTSGPARVTPANFAAQIDMLLSRYAPASLEAIAGGQTASDAFAVTFDDGYAETMRRALPVLTKAGVPATVFVSTDHVARQRGFWWDEVRRLLRHGQRPAAAAHRRRRRALVGARRGGRAPRRRLAAAQGPRGHRRGAGRAARLGRSRARGARRRAPADRRRAARRCRRRRSSTSARTRARTPTCATWTPRGSWTSCRAAARTSRAGWTSSPRTASPTRSASRAPTSTPTRAARPGRPAYRYAVLNSPGHGDRRHRPLRPAAPARREHGRRRRSRRSSAAPPGARSGAPGARDGAPTCIAASTIPTHVSVASATCTHTISAGRSSWNCSDADDALRGQQQADARQPRRAARDRPRAGAPATTWRRRARRAPRRARRGGR